MVAQLASFVLIWGSITVAAALTVLAWRQRPKPGAVPFAVLMAAGTWWVATSSVGLFTVSRPLRLLLQRLEWFGFLVIPAAWLVFALEYTSRDEYVNRRFVALLAVVPAITLALVWTDGHGLVYATRSVNVYGGDISLIAQQYGPWFWAYTAYAYLLFAVGTLLILQLVVDARDIYRGQIAALLIAILAPWVGNVIFVSGLSSVLVSGFTTVQEFDVTPFTFLISGAAGLAALTQFDLLKSVPVSSRIARDYVIESMDDGVVVVDTDDTVADINPQAAAILDTDEEVAVGQEAAELLPVYERLLARDDRAPTAVVELDRPESTCYYEVSLTPLSDDHGRLTGRIVVLHDVTDRRNRVRHLDVLNRVLRHNLRNEMNVVYGYADRLDGEEPGVIAEEIKAKAMAMVDLGDKAREIDRILDDDRSQPVGLARILALEAERARDEFPSVEFTIERPDDAVEVPQPTAAVLRNLIENAAEHNTNEDPWVRVTVDVDGVAEGDTAFVTIRVADNGPGIPESERSVLHDGADETPLEHSSGLGLWLVNWGVQRMGGSIDLVDDHEPGTTIRVSVPRRDTGGTEDPEDEGWSEAGWRPDRDRAASERRPAGTDRDGASDRDTPSNRDGESAESVDD